MTALKGKSQAVKENINWSCLAVHSCRGGYYRSNLLELKYHSVGDAVAELGTVGEIREVFIGFQEYLYMQRE